MGSEQIIEFLLACREEEPTSVGRKLEVAQQEEVPAENAIVIPVVEPQEETTNTRKETMACQEMEARLEEEEPASVDTKPEAAQQDEVLNEDAEVMSVGEPKEKRRRDRKLAAERRRLTLKNSTRENCGPHKKLAVDRRGTTRRTKVALKTPRDHKMSHRTTVARRKTIPSSSMKDKFCN
jgi:hypothetical protein